MMFEGFGGFGVHGVQVFRVSRCAVSGFRRLDAFKVSGLLRFFGLGMFLGLRV